MKYTERYRKKKKNTWQIRYYRGNVGEIHGGKLGICMVRSGSIQKNTGVMEGNTGKIATTTKMNFMEKYGKYRGKI